MGEKGEEEGSIPSQMPSQQFCGKRNGG